MFCKSLLTHSTRGHCWVSITHQREIIFSTWHCSSAEEHRASVCRVTTGTRTQITDFEADRRGNLDNRFSYYLCPSQGFMHKPKALEAKIDELKYPALNEDPVSQTLWKHRLWNSCTGYPPLWTPLQMRAIYRNSPVFRNPCPQNGGVFPFNNP